MGAMIKKLFGTAAVLLGTTAMSFAQSAPSTVNLIFVVDESGSMSGEHAFLGSVATGIEASLNGSGINSVNFGLIGYGSSADVAGRVLSVGGGNIGSAADFVAATSNLVVTGVTEDGYSGIRLGLNTFDVTSAATTFVLVTDEDRDVLDATETFSTIQTSLSDAGAGLVVVVDAGFQDTQGNAAIATDGEDALIQVGSSFTVTEYDPATGVTSADGTTEADYINLALASDAGCAADLNVLRNGGDSATAFSEVFVSCLTEVATVLVVTPTGRQIELPLTNFGRTGLAILANHNGTIRGITFVRPRAARPSVSQNASIVDDAYGIKGLRVYSTVNGYTGDFDGTDTANAYSYTGGGVIVGTDYTIDLPNAGSLRTGVNVGWSRTDTNEDDSDNSSDREGVTLGLYSGFWSDQNWYTYGSLQYGRHDIESRRVDSGVTFTARPDNIAWAGEIEGGYTFTPSIPLVTGITPFVGAGFIQSEISDYEENNGGISTEDYSQHSAYGKLGVRATAEKAISRNVLYGAVDLAANIPFEDDDTQVAVSDGSTATVEATDATQLNLGLELGVQVGRNGTIYTQYNGIYTEDLTQHGLTLGLNYAF